MRRNLFDIIVMAMCLLLFGLYGWHAQYGPRGFDNQASLMGQVVTLESERDGIRARREALEARVSLLRPETIDPDMLDEMARRVLGFVRQDDVLVR
jgi:cell division protein FtsB